MTASLHICLLVVHCVLCQTPTPTPPTWRREPEDTVANVEDDITLYCEIDNLPPNTDPIALRHNVKWSIWRTDGTGDIPVNTWLDISQNSELNGYISGPTGLYPHYSITGTYNLRINGVKDIARGDYNKFRCQEQISLLEKEIHVVKPVAPNPPTISSVPSSLNNIKVEDNIQLTCSSTGGVEAPTIEWYRDNIKVTGGTTYVPNQNWATTPEVASTNVLTRQLKKEDNGIKFECRVNNKALTTEQLVSETLNVKYAPQSVIVGPHSPTYEVIKDTSLTLTCTATDGNPGTYTYTWKKDNTVINGATSKDYTISRVQTSDNGKHRCTADNGIGSMMSSNFVTINVLYPPEITGLQDKYTHREGEQNKEITCVAEGNPNQITYTWTKSGGTANANGATLIIADKNDIGDYTCTATNMMQPTGGTSVPGKGEKTINVDVLYVPGAASPGPTPVIANQTQSATLHCSPGDRGNPASTFKWEWQRGTTLLTGQTPSIVIDDVDVDEDDGTYTCTPTNDVGNGISAKVVLEVQAKPTISSQHPDTINAINTQPLPSTVKCADKARPGSSYNWYLNDTLITSNSYYMAEELHTQPDKWTNTESSLKWKSGLTDGQRRDASGDVRCQAGNAAGNDEKTFRINVQYKPYDASINLSESTVTKVENETLEDVHCTAPANPTSDYEWLFNNTVTKSSNRILSLGKLTRNHHGTYKCNASNFIGHDTTQFSLVVNYPAMVTSFTSSSQQPVIEHSPFTLTCHVDSRPASTIEIALDGKVVGNAGSEISLMHSVGSATCRNMGKYACNADNTIGEGVAYVSIIVHCSPSEDEENPSERIVNTKVGQTTHVIFKNIGYPKPTYTWYQIADDGETRDPLPDHITPNVNSTNSYTHQAYITITGVKPTDFGKYVCVASNLRNNVTQTFEVNAAGPPDKPKNVRVIDSRKTAVSLFIQWVPGYHNKESQTFSVEYKNLTKGEWVLYKKDIPDPPPTPFKVHPLDSNTSYAFRVESINTEGSSGFTVSTNEGKTKALPQSKEFVERFRKEGNSVIVTITSFPKDCTSVTVYCCKQNSNDCLSKNITDTQVTPQEVTFDTEAGKYTVSYHLYDTDDVIIKTEPRIAEKRPEQGTDVGPIIGGVIGALVVAALVIVIVVLVLRKRRNDARGKGGTEMNTRRSLILDQGSGRSNESFEESMNPYGESPGQSGNNGTMNNGNGIVNDSINPYGELGDMNPYGVTVNASGNAINERPIDVNNTNEAMTDPAALYAEPDKSKKNKAGKTPDNIAALYAQPNKDKKRERENKDADIPVDALYAQPDKAKKNKNKGKKPVDALYAEPDKTKKNKRDKQTEHSQVAQPADPIYAESEKKKKREKPDHAPKPQVEKPSVASKPNIKAKPTTSNKPRTPTKPNVPTKPQPYMNVQNTAVQPEGEYAEVKNPKKNIPTTSYENGGHMPDGENPYANTGSIPDGENPYANSGSIPDGENPYANSSHIPAGDNPYQNWELPNTEPNPQPPPPPDPENPALLYADLSFNQNQNGGNEQSDVPVRQEEPTEYAAIDFKRTGKGVNV